MSLYWWTFKFFICCTSTGWDGLFGRNYYWNKNTKPSGRVSAEFDLEKLENDPSLDILLQEGDKVTIPEFLDHIYIFGEINTEGTIRYKEGEGFKYYIDKKEDIAPVNKKNVYVLHPNGETTLVSDNRNIFMRQRSDEMKPTQVQ